MDRQFSLYRSVEWQGSAFRRACCWE